MERVWYIFGNGQGRFSVAKHASGEFMFPTAGPMTWDEAAAWMRDNGQPGW
jgi:hypothetical protein